jgi:hypothetical protein
MRTCNEDAHAALERVRRDPCFVRRADMLAARDDVSRSGNRQYPLAEPLKGFGRGLVTIAASGSQQTIVIGDKRLRDEAAAAVASRTAITR